MFLISETISLISIVRLLVSLAMQLTGKMVPTISGTVLLVSVVRLLIGYATLQISRAASLVALRCCDLAASMLQPALPCRKPENPGAWLSASCS